MSAEHDLVDVEPAAAFHLPVVRVLVEMGLAQQQNSGVLCDPVPRQGARQVL
jgi:hypothetical protein